MRIFYLRDLLNYMNIDEFIHFDSDVLIYKPFNKIKYSFDKKFNITPLSNNELILATVVDLKKMYIAQSQIAPRIPTKYK